MRQYQRETSQSETEKMRNIPYVNALDPPQFAIETPVVGQGPSITYCVIKHAVTGYF